MDGSTKSLSNRSIEKRDKKKTYPLCTGGRRACPPEDCGGPHVFGRILDMLENGSKSEQKEAKEHLGPYFIPDHFDSSEILFDDPAKCFQTYFDEF